EHNQRLPDAATLQARFIPALYLDEEPAWARRLLELAAAGRAGGAARALPPAAGAAPSEPALRPLPTPLTPPAGRERVVAELAGLLRSPRAQAARLVTLMGPSGVGKTRLALEVARAIEGNFADGAAFVELADTIDPARVADVIASALGVGESASHSL